jgi:hypothetical protein
VLEPITAARSAAINSQAMLEPITAAQSAAINSQAVLEPITELAIGHCG